MYNTDARSRSIPVYCLFLFLLIVSSCSTPSSPTQSLGNIWTTASSKGFTPRGGLTASVVGGKIYAIGGYYFDSTHTNAILYDTVEVFDPSSNAWSRPLTSGSFTGGIAITASVIDGKIYVMGWKRDSVGVGILQVFDPSTNAWSTPSTSGRLRGEEGLSSRVAAGKIYARSILVLGSVITPTIDTQGFQVFDPANNAWSIQKGYGFFDDTSGFNCWNVFDNNIYVVGKKVCNIFDPTTSTWSTFPTKGTTFGSGATSCVLNGKIYVFGDSTNIFDPLTKTWSTPPTTGTFTPRDYPASCVLGNQIYVLGGFDPLDPIQVFTP
jgi:hypothetical protein